MRSIRLMPMGVSGLGLQILAGAAAGLFSASGGAADVERGRALFETDCVACHAVIASVRDKSGPNLNGVVGRKAGTEQYSWGFSDELLASQITWQVRSLQLFMTAPARLIPGTTMVYRGLSDAEQRLDIACYLEQVSGNGNRTPSAQCAEP